MWKMLNVWEELNPGGCFESRDFKSEPMSLCEHNLWPGPRLILKSNIRAILIIQMSENGPETFIMDCFVLPRSQDTCNNVYHHETHRHKQSPSLLHRTKATDLLRTCVIAVFSLDNVNPLSVSLAVIATPGLIRDVWRMSSSRSRRMKQNNRGR